MIDKHVINQETGTLSREEHSDMFHPGGRSGRVKRNGRIQTAFSFQHQERNSGSSSGTKLQMENQQESIRHTKLFHT